MIEVVEEEMIEMVTEEVEEIIIVEIEIITQKMIEVEEVDMVVEEITITIMIMETMGEVTTKEALAGDHQDVEDPTEVEMDLILQEEILHK